MTTYLPHSPLALFALLQQSCRSALPLRIQISCLRMFAFCCCVLLPALQALLQKHSAVGADGYSDRPGCTVGAAKSAQRQAERAHLAAFMSRRLLL